MYLIRPRQDSKDNPNPPNPNPPAASKSGSGMSGWGIFFLITFLLLAVGFAAYVVYVHMRSRRLGLPSPSWKSFVPFMSSTRRSPSSRPSAGFLGFIKSKLPGGKSGGGGAVLSGSTGYTGAAQRSRSTRAQFGQLRQEDDEAWDARGYRGYDDDHDTELNDNRGRGAEGYSYTGGPATFDANRSQPYGAQHLDADGEPIRGRSRSRDPPPPTYQPVNPRVEQVRRMSGESFGVVSVKGGRGSLDGERRSIFREDMS